MTELPSRPADIDGALAPAHAEARVRCVAPAVEIKNPAQIGLQTSFQSLSIFM